MFLEQLTGLKSLAPCLAGLTSTEGELERSRMGLLEVSDQRKGEASLFDLGSRPGFQLGHQTHWFTLGQSHLLSLTSLTGLWAEETGLNGEESRRRCSKQI